ncbi:MAG: hypothetical protein ACERKD_24460 [Prolixibacteraceae bacterium]
MKYPVIPVTAITLDSGCFFNELNKLNELNELKGWMSRRALLFKNKD